VILFPSVLAQASLVRPIGNKNPPALPREYFVSGERGIARFARDPRGVASKQSDQTLRSFCFPFSTFRKQAFSGALVKQKSRFRGI